jgi:hypothetical protein
MHVRNPSIQLQIEASQQILQHALLMREKRGQALPANPPAQESALSKPFRAMAVDQTLPLKLSHAVDPNG